MSARSNILGAVLTATALVAYGSLATAIHLGRLPGPSRLVARADADLAAARAGLAGKSAAPQRWAAYRREMAGAEATLRRAVAAAPVAGEPAIALAAVLWESDPPIPGPARDELVRLADAGATLVPYRAEAQRSAGALLLQMGDEPAGVRRLRAAVELDPVLTGEVVGSLLARGFDPGRVRAALPPTAEVLAELAGAYPRPADWLAEVESFPGALSRGLLLRYGVRCRESGEHERLRRHLSRLGVQADAGVEVERLIQQAEAQLALGEAGPAVAGATRARTLAPDDVRVAEYLGGVLLRAGDADRAATVFDEALRAAALGGRPPADRARLYRRLGQAQEARRRPDLAVDAYRLAIGLDSGEAAARARLDALLSHGRVSRAGITGS